MNATTEIPLSKLVPFAGNVRKTHNKKFVEELAASIRAHGLQQNLVVRPEGRKYAVVAGGQRLKALLLLLKQGDIRPDYLVTCKIAGGDIDATELSLAENVMRDEMHPADRFEAFRDLVDKGQSIADIAARFGTNETHVRQLLKLARVSPAVLKAYRAGSLTLEQVMAFAVSDDHAAQEHVLANFRQHSRDPRGIREALTENEIPATDRRVKFVGLKAYEKAGGAVRQDLFREGAESVFLLDAALLDRLVTEKLDRAAKELAKEGWKWTEARAVFGYQEQGQFRGLRPEPAPLPPKLAKEVAALEAEAAKLEQEWENAGEDAEYPDRLQEIRDRLDDIDRDREDVWTPEKLAIAGAVVTIGHDGKADITRGLVRPEDMPKPEKKGKTKAAAESGEGAEQAPALSAALVESLTAHKSAALAAALAARPDVAVAAVVHAFASGIFLNVRKEERCLQLAAQPQPREAVSGSKAVQQLDADRAKWSEILPRSENALWRWCMEQDRETLLALLAFCAAATVNAVQGKHDRPEGERLVNAELLGLALNLDMRSWFTPDAANFFSRVSKAQVFEALKEARNGQPPAPAWEKLKKPELAALAERELAGKGWLPEILRPVA
jgi:ParB family chromosome partitioning protein